MLKRCWAAVLLGVLLLSGCGQKGPLYLPDETAAHHSAPAESVHG
ncbi:LPS translocon maturation chaperone LptM [Marinobacterium weihaiense]|uniref:Lipoprotein n=1 Tax=Marinobacterium weihaiense TaxID=2851016 RepID=A0ABS6MAF6_9GAMM|nr:lipoprotein [Marinobacterium weihaiense]MBV0933273.1 lipoprotein [Marinobacterium weihaiense]